jgi:hypothetical protein
VKTEVKNIFKPVAPDVIQGLERSFPTLGKQMELLQGAYSAWHQNPTRVNFAMYQSYVSGMTSILITDMTGMEVVQNGLMITAVPEKEEPKIPDSKVSEKKRKSLLPATSPTATAEGIIPDATEKKRLKTKGSARNKKTKKNEFKDPKMFLKNEYPNINDAVLNGTVRFLEMSIEAMATFKFPKECREIPCAWTSVLVTVNQNIGTEEEKYNLLMESTFKLNPPTMKNFKQYYSKVNGELTTISKTSLRTAILARSDAKLKLPKKAATPTVETEDLENEAHVEFLSNSLSEIANGQGSFLGSPATEAAANALASLKGANLVSS